MALPLHTVFLWATLFTASLSGECRAENALKCSNDAVDGMEEFAADIRLDLMIDSSCTGIRKKYVKEIFKTKSAVEAEMLFANQAFCFRKKNGKIVGCNLKTPKRLASVSKVFSMDFLHTHYGDTDIGVSARLGKPGELCLENDGLSNLTRTEFNSLVSRFKSEQRLEKICVSPKFTYGGNDECLKEYTDAMHSQSRGVITALQECSDRAMQESLGFKNVGRGNCGCTGETQTFSVKLKDRTQSIMAASDSWQILMLYEKLGAAAKNGLQDYLRQQNQEQDQLNLKDPVGNSSENRATCESVLNAPAVKECKSPPIACADSEGSTFNRFTKYVGGKTKMKTKTTEGHEEYYEKFDDHLCGKTGSIASEGLKNFVGCFQNRPKNPIQSFAIFLDGKDVTRLREMKAHTEVLEDFYQQLLDPKTQKKLFK